MPHSQHPHTTDQHPAHQPASAHGHGHQHGPGHEHGAHHGDGPGHQHGAGHEHGPGHQHGAGHEHGPGHQHGADQGDGLAEILDLDAEIAAGPLAALTARIAEFTGDHPVRAVVDLGSGTGSGTFALLRRFPEATVTAVDSSAEMLDHLAASAARHGFTGRIHPLRADLDTGWPGLGPADLVWASSSMHHVADPDRVLRDIRATLRPGGLFAMIEMESMPRFLPDDLGIGRPGLEARCHAAADAARAEHLPHIGSDWPSRLVAAGFTVREAGTVVVDLPPPLTGPAVRYAEATLRRSRSGMADRLAADDLATLDLLLTGDGPHALARRPDLAVHSTRHVWLATPA